MEEIKAIQRKRSEFVHTDSIKGRAHRKALFFMYHFTLYVKNKDACKYLLEVML